MDINTYARGFKTGGMNYDTVMASKYVGRRAYREEPPMGPGPRYAPEKASMPEYNGGTRGNKSSKKMSY